MCGGEEEAAKKNPKKQPTSTKVDDFGNKGLGNSYIWNCPAGSCKQYVAGKWGLAGSSNLLSHLR